MSPACVIPAKAGIHNDVPQESPLCVSALIYSIFVLGN